MAESVACPHCQVRLELPALPTGQPVQCPRCARVFEPTAVRPAPKLAPRVVEVAEDDVPVEPAISTPIEPLRGDWKASVATLALAAFLLSCLLQIYVHYRHYELIQEDLAAPPHLGPGNMFDLDGVLRRHDWQVLRDIATVIHSVTFWPTVIAFLIWLHQASRNAWALRADGLQFRPLTTFSFFIPLLNLVWPYCMVQEIWRASSPRAVLDPLAWKEAPCSLSIRLWWASYLAALFIGVLLFVTTTRNDDDMENLVLAGLRRLCIIVGAALMIYIINDIRRRQNQRYARLCEVE